MKSLPLHRFDMDQLIRNLGGNSDIIPKLIEVFHISSEQCFARLEQGLLRNDMDMWRSAAHELKGAALSITANRLAEVCAHAEALNDLQSDEARSLLDHIRKKLALLTADFDAYFAKA